MADPRVSTMPSIAIDPLGSDLAAGWQLAELDYEALVLVQRIRGEVTTAFEVGRMEEQGWVSPVAIHDGTMAILFGRSAEPPTLALVSPCRRRSHPPRGGWSVSCCSDCGAAGGSRNGPRCHDARRVSALTVALPQASIPGTYNAAHDLLTRRSWLEVDGSRSRS
jgi:hypothetical protein